MTPVLCDQLEAMRGEPGERYMRFLREVRAPIHAEDARGPRGRRRARLAAEVRRAASDYTRARARLRGARPRPDRGLPRSSSGVELWTSAATHALLPLIATDAGLRLQLATGTASHMRRFGALVRRLLAAGVRVCARARARAGRRRRAGVLRRPDRGGGLRPPACRSPPRRARGGADRLADRPARLERPERLPGHPLYRNYWGRTVHDLRPWSNAGEPYDHEAARALAREHARDFVARVAAPARARRPALLRARHGAARALVVRGTGVARRGAGGGARRRACGS